MLLPTTGYLEFTWDPQSNAEGYYVKVYKNNTFKSTETVLSNYIKVESLKEGDSVFGYVYSFSGDNISTTNIHLDTQSVPVTNFHDDNLTFSFNEIKFNGENLPCENQNNLTVCTGYSFSDNNLLEFNVINPRNTGVLSSFGVEPFLSGIQYQTFTNNNPATDVLQLNSFSYTSESLDFDSRSYDIHISTHDYYGSGITGVVQVSGVPIQINFLQVSSSLSGSNDIHTVTPSYNTQPTKIEYALYEDSDRTTQISTGQSFTPNNFTVTSSHGQSGYLSLIPHDWFGSGEQFNYPSVLFNDDVQVPVYNEISSFIVVKDSPYGTFLTSCQYLSNHASGSYFELSIDPDSTNSFDENSFFTGRFDNFESNFEFQYFDLFSNNNSPIDFFFNINLYNSGTADLEDSSQKHFLSLPPSINRSGISFDYVLGETHIEFDSHPNFEYTGVDFLVSGKNDIGFEVYSGNNIINNDLNSLTHVKLVNAADHNIVYDQSILARNGKVPGVSVSEVVSATLDGSTFLNINTIGNGSAVNEVVIYQKPTFKDVSSAGNSVSQDLLEVLECNDYVNFLSHTGYLGYNIIEAPSSLSRNQTYESNGGHYESGLHYTYRFLPINGYGTGTISDPYDFSFKTNQVTNFIDSDVTQSTSEIQTLNTNLANLESSVITNDSDISSLAATSSLTQTTLNSDISSLASSVTDNLNLNRYIINQQLNIGQDSFEIDYSSANFTSSPFVFVQIGSTVSGSPVIPAQLSGFPTTDSATFILSNTLPNTGYFIQGIAELTGNFSF